MTRRFRFGLRLVKAKRDRDSIARSGIPLRNRLDFRLVCLFVLAACLGPGAAREAVAQQRWWQRDILRACAGGPSRCHSEAMRLWESFATAVLVAIQPQSSESRIARDGMFVHPDAPAFYVLKGLVPASSGATVCGQLPASRDELARLMCGATRQLRPSGRQQWPDEIKELEALRQRLVASSCLPSAPQDPCALVAPPTVVAAPPADPEERVDLADQRLSEPFVELQ